MRDKIFKAPRPSEYPNNEHGYCHALDRYCKQIESEINLLEQDKLEHWAKIEKLEGENKELREGLIECVNHLRITVNIFDTPTHDLIKTIDKLIER